MNTELPNPSRVLVIDDEEAIHKLIEARLRPEGITVTGELDGVHGIARAISESPDLILLDVGLPNLDGFQVCRKLKEHPATRNIPIIFLTGETTMEAKVRGLDMGAVDYVTKPFEQTELRARVRAGLRTKRLQDLLERKSFLDGLTGLWNRPYLDQRLVSELNLSQRYARPLGLMMVDIDHFKLVNDTYGHLFGDIVLQGVAEELRGYARRSDLVARYGGEEFGLLLTDTPLSSGVYVAERLRASVEAREFEVRGKSVTVTASFGLGCTENIIGEITPQSLIDAADRALFASKDAGRNCVHMCKGDKLTRVTASDLPSNNE